MRHASKINTLGRTASHRKALMANMASSLIKHKRIKTTLAKAKALRSYVEPMLTQAKTDTTAARRLVFAKVQDKEVVKILFDEIAQKIADRPGGYTRILKLGQRVGDAAEICFIELVDYNDLMKKGEGKATKTRRRRKKKATDAAPENTASEATENSTEE
ncbi:50S ribosomal protein L17 [Hugenholtzia roseola]|uniref:50S ribosomal protein L17 n=1 Tax=Hugenholtzia roseola TaxID=1002 RepID=UPI00047A85AB|nr:50S ribosomal protein L17 [Hugenholtzia roseola]